jgi:hypothetical protein
MRCGAEGRCLEKAGGEKAIDGGTDETRIGIRELNRGESWRWKKPPTYS